MKKIRKIIAILILIIFMFPYVIVNAAVSTEMVLAMAGKNSNMSDFYYNGIPEGEYTVKGTSSVGLIEALTEIFDFLVALIPNLVKMVFVGWTAIFETLITSTVKTVSGSDDILSIPVTSTEIESNDNISIEKIVFNQISVFDVNFFNFNEQNEENAQNDENDKNDENNPK